MKNKIITLCFAFVVALFIASLILGGHFNKVAYNQHSLKLKDYALQALKWSVKQNAFIDGLLEVLDEGHFIDGVVEPEDYMAFMDKKIDEAFSNISIEILPYEWGFLSSKAQIVITNKNFNDFGEIVADIEFSNILFLSKRADITLKSSFIANHSQLSEFFPSGEFSRLSLYRFLGDLEMLFKIATIKQESQNKELELNGLQVGINIDTQRKEILKTFVEIPLYKRLKRNDANEITESYELKNLSIISDYTQNPLLLRHLVNSDFSSFMNDVVNNIDIDFKSLLWRDSNTHIVINNLSLDFPINIKDGNIEANGSLKFKKLSNLNDKRNIFLSQDIKNFELLFSLKNISTSIADDLFDILLIPEILHRYYALNFVDNIFKGKPEIAIYDSSLLLNDKKMRFSYEKTYEGKKALEHLRISSQYSANELFSGYDELVGLKDFSQHFIKDKQGNEFVYDYKSVEENGNKIISINEASAK